MIVTTTAQIEGHPIKEYRQIVASEIIMGANVVRDVFATFSDFFGGRSGVYESKFHHAREMALKELENRAIEQGANALVGVKSNTKYWASQC